MGYQWGDRRAVGGPYPPPGWSLVVMLLVVVAIGLVSYSWAMGRWDDRDGGSGGADVLPATSTYPVPLEIDGLTIECLVTQEQGSGEVVVVECEK